MTRYFQLHQKKFSVNESTWEVLPQTYFHGLEWLFSNRNKEEKWESKCTDIDYDEKNAQINLNNKLLCFKGNAFADNFKKPKSLHLELEWQTLGTFISLNSVGEMLHRLTFCNLWPPYSFRVS